MSRRLKWTALLTAGGMLLPGANGAVSNEWRIAPSETRGKIADYAPSFDKHFQIKDGVLVCSCGLGKEVFEAHKCSTFEGAGPIWATHKAWPEEAESFDLTFDYKWFQAEPMVKYGDFPEMTVGFRLNAQGKGYLVSWGMLGQIRIRRMGAPGDGLIGQGCHPGVKGAWVKVRILAAGPVVKVKIWPEMNRGKPVEEPARWGAEAYDNWEGTDQRDYRKGSMAVGFTGRRLFDTCVYEYKNVQIRALTADEAAAVKFFDPATSPTGPRGSSDVSNIASPGVKPVSPSAGAPTTPNLKMNAAEGRIALESEDGQSAFLWRKTGGDARMFVVRAKSSGDARPIVGIQVTDGQGQRQIAYLDPAWREGVAALLHDKNHTVNSASFRWKPDTEYDFIIQAAHWLKWQIVETGDPANRVNFSGNPYGDSRNTKMLGLGVAGKDGAVTITGIFPE